MIKKYGLQLIGWLKEDTQQTVTMLEPSMTTISLSQTLARMLDIKKVLSKILAMGGMDLKEESRLEAITRS